MAVLSAVVNMKPKCTHFVLNFGGFELPGRHVHEIHEQLQTEEQVCENWRFTAEELQKELEARGFSISKAEAEMDMGESEEEEA